MKPGIIILGAPRSGTTLLRRLIGAHPNIACPGETFLLRASALFLRGDRIAHGMDFGVLGGLRLCGYETAEVLERLRQFVFGFHEEIAAREGKSRWAEKTALDSFYLDEIETVYSGHAKFVCITRHGADVVRSWHDWTEANQLFVAEVHDYIRKHPRPSVAYAHAWVDLTNSLLDFAARAGDDAVACRYEDLVADTETELRRIFEFLDEPWDDGITARAMEAEESPGLSDWKSHGLTEISSASIGRANEFPRRELSLVGSIINPTLSRCGYDEIEVEQQLSPEEAEKQYQLSLLYTAARAADTDQSA